MTILTNFQDVTGYVQVVNGRKIIIDDKAREFKDRDGVMYWQLLRRNEKIPVPPPEAIEIDNKGKKCVEAYRTETGEYVFAQDRGNIQEIPKQLLKIKNDAERKEKIEEWKKSNRVIDAFQPLTTKQRVILVNQIRKAQEKKTKRWQDYILPIAGIGALVIITIALMVFYADMAKPLLDMADKQNNYATIQKEQLQILKEIKNDIQVIGGSSYPPKPPN